MPRSMTSFSRTDFELYGGIGSWEIRSVNHRYLEVSIRLPDEFRSLEVKVRERIASKATRGKIDCTLRFRQERTGFQRILINEAAAKEVVNALTSITKLGGPTVPLNPVEILQWPGVMELPELDLEPLSKELLSELDSTLNDFTCTRSREGTKLGELLLLRLNSMLTEVEKFKSAVPAIIAGQIERHKKRMLEIMGEIDASRAEQECALLAQRLDVAEELDRLHTHVEEVHNVLKRRSPIGRRLDFLMQELNREANTLSSKSATAESTASAVEIKVLIEQMREQVQNIE